MVTVPELDALHPRALADAARAWRNHAQKLRFKSEDLAKQGSLVDAWEGDAADAASRHIDKLRRDLSETAEQVGKIPDVLLTAADELEAARNRLRRALAITGDDVQVHANGRVEYDNRSDYLNQDTKQLAEQIADEVATALRQANQADQAATEALRRLMPKAVGLAPAATELAAASVSAQSIPPAGTSPESVKKWWDSLSPLQQETVLMRYSDRIGNLDGIPASVRHRANVTNLANSHGLLRERIARLEAKDINHRSPEDEQALEEARRNLRGVEAIQQRVEQDGDTHVLAVDPDGLGRAIVATGNPDTAKNIATLVPGTDSNLGGIGGLMDDANRLASTANLADPNSPTVAISWQGYDAPQGLHNAAFESYAQEARSSLDGFQDGLRATHEGQPSQNTVIGHSYGSTVIGHTARDMGLDADNAVFIGSPGVGVEHASELGLPPENVHASVAENDIIHVTNTEIGGHDVGHGPDPASAEFGGNTFESDPGTAWPLGLPSPEAHMEYYNQNSKSLRSMANIVTGAR